MSIDVRTATDGDDIWDAGTGWRVQDGHLWIVAAGRTIAEYPPGQWTAVWRDDETAEQVQDGDATDEVTPRINVFPGSHLTTVTVDLSGPIADILRHIDAIRADRIVTVLR